MSLDHRRDPTAAARQSQCSSEQRDPQLAATKPWKSSEEAPVTGIVSAGLCIVGCVTEKGRGKAAIVNDVGMISMAGGKIW